MSEQKVVLKVLKNVFFYYTQLNTPVLTKAAKDLGAKIDPENPKKNCEYTLKIAMPYERFRNLKKQPWALKVSNFPQAKEFTLAQFESAFHSEGGMPDFGEGVEEVVLIKFSQKSMSAAGKEMNAPKILGKKGKVQDLHGNNIDQETSLGNGTKGWLQVRPVDFDGKFDPYLYPHKVVVTDLVVFEGGGGIDDAEGEDDLDFEDLDDTDLDEGSSSEEGIENDDFDDDIPF